MELGAILEGVKLAPQMKIKDLIVESDCKETIGVVHERKLCPAQVAHILIAIHVLMRLSWSIIVTHIVREANYSAEKLARMVAS